MSVQAYNKRVPEMMLYSRAPSVLEGVVERRTERFHPNGPRSGYTAGQTIEFYMTTDQLQDLTSSCLNLTLDITGTSASSARISNILDCIKNLNVYYNDLLLESVQDVNSWSNTFLAYTATEQYISTEGDVLLGVNNQRVANSSSSTERAYSIPLAILSGVCRASNYFPVLGSKLRFSFELAGNKELISFPKNTDNAYVLNDVSIQCDTIIVSEDYRQKLQQVIMSDQGLRFNYGTCQTQKHQVAGSTTQYLRIPYNLSNALSLILLQSYSDASKNYVGDQWTLQHQSFPFPNITRVEVRSGSKVFTGQDGLTTYTELYANAEKVISSFNNFSGSGYVNYKMFTDGYTKAATIAGGSYGLCPIAINLERDLISDDNTINSGISSAQGNSTEFDVRIYTSSALNPADSFLSCIVHKRTLKFAMGGASVEY